MPAQAPEDDEERDLDRAQCVTFKFNPPEADKGLIPRRLRRCNVFVETPLLCGGVVHLTVGSISLFK